MQTIFEGFCEFFGRARKAKSPRDAGAFGGEREWKDSNLQPPVSETEHGRSFPILLVFFHTLWRERVNQFRGFTW